jgi:hypothetical protein
MLTIQDPTEEMAVLTAMDPTEGMAMLTAVDPTEGMAMLPAVDLADSMAAAILTDPDPAERMAFSMTPNLMAGLVEVGHLPFPCPTEDDLNLCPVGAADWSRVTATSSESPECSTTPKESRPATTRGPSRVSQH